MSLAECSETVPVLTCGAVSKIFMIPGWRLGWILIHDRRGAFKKQVKKTFCYNKPYDLCD